MTTAPLVELRPLAAADLAEVHRLEVAASLDPWSFDLLAGELTSPGADRDWLVATEATGADGPTIVGFGGILLILDEAHIMNLVVHPARRRRGVAGHLLTTLLRRATDRGATAATLEVRSGNGDAISLYRRFGFQTAGRRPRYYGDGEDAEIMWHHGLHRLEREEHRHG